MPAQPLRRAPAPPSLFLRRAGLLAACLVALTLPATVLASPARVLPPGQEALVEQMLAPAGGLPAGWTLESASIRSDTIVARYRRAEPPAEVALELGHVGRARATPPVFQSGQLALHGTDVPADLLAALQASIVVREPGLKWLEAAGLPTAAPAAPTAGGDPHVRLAEAMTALDGGDRAKAGQILAEVLRAAADRPVADRAAVLTGAAWLQRVLAPTEARATFEAALAVAGDAHLVRASALYGLERDAEAQAALVQAATGADAKACSAAGLVATGLDRAGRTDQALAAMAAWFERQPACTEAVLHATRLARRAGVPDKALLLLEKARQLAPRDLGVAVHLAHTYKTIGRGSEALQLLDGLDLQAGDLDKALVLDITRVYLDVEGAEASLALHRRRADADPQAAVPNFIVGTILHHRGDWAESDKYLERSAAAFAQEPRQHLYMAMNAFHLGRQKDAERLVERAGQLGSQDPDIQYCRATIHTYVAPDKAIADLQDYLRLTAGSHETYAPKQAKVARMLEDLLACRDARDVRECLDLQATTRKAMSWAPAVLGAVLLLVGLGAWWRRKRGAKVALLLPILLAGHGLPGVAEAGPLEQALHVAEPTAFAPPGGWHVATVTPAADRIVVRFQRDGQELDALLLPAGAVPQPWARTRSYDLGYLGGQAPDAQGRALLDAFATWLQAHDRGQRPLQAPVTAARDLRPTSAAPATLSAQWTWLTGLDRVQVLLSAALLLVAAAFFFASPGWSSLS